MQLHFHCSNTGQFFAANHSALVDNQGVITDQLGQKNLKATVALLSPCPHCGELHRYPVEEISCPAALE